MSSNIGDSRRPAIPADLKRKVLIEAGHRCAIPTCRHIKVELHHIVPWNKCREHKYDNLIALCPNCHNLADAGGIDNKSLHMYKLNLRTVHDKFSQLEIDVLFEANKVEEGQAIKWPPFMNILIKRICEVGFVKLASPGRNVSAGGIQISPVDLTITQDGRDYIQEMGEAEM